ncbi:MAG: hypothetical protein HRU38_17265 [Saccharospirillaceae bacterium]|nr:hypothetical protein [Pseudomonadales bacterium]NRB80388.1 hypothetical protein [Saccharospirillaceae bacterium]
MKTLTLSKSTISKAIVTNRKYFGTDTFLGVNPATGELSCLSTATPLLNFKGWVQVRKEGLPPATDAEFFKSLYDRNLPIAQMQKTLETAGFHLEVFDDDEAAKNILQGYLK